LRTISYSALGDASDVLQFSEIATPSPAENEVLVELRFSGVNPSDVKSRKGRPGMSKPVFDKIIPHSDGSGVITAVGNGVSASRIGERVWIWNGQWQRPSGTAATHIVLDQSQAVVLPDDVSFETGAVLGIPGLTAAHAVFANGDVTGLTVLVQGGGGTVGLLAVQLAKWGGATVIATCSPTDMDECRAAGADHVFDYRDPELVALVLSANGGALIDRIVEVEFGLNIEADASLIKPNGIIAVYGSAKSLTPQVPFIDLLFKAATLDIILIYLLPLDERLQIIDRLNQALAEGALNCPIARVFPLKDTIAAHELVESGVRDGAVLIDVSL
jgi:NADPH2:quinone reductase